MVADFGVVLPLWSFHDEPALLERVAGEVPLDHVTVPAVTGATSSFRLAVAADGPHFHTEGGWHYPATAKLYGAAGIKPVRARWFGTTDVVARLRETAGRLGLAVIVRLELRTVAALVETEAHLARRNAWGQDLPTAGICPCNPHAQELVRATIEDVRRYDPAGLELVDWSLAAPGFNPGPGYLAWDATARGPLSTCFCPACRQIAEQAGLDVERVARGIRDLLPVFVRRAAPDACPAAPGSQPTPRELEALQQLAAYDDARAEALARWRARLAEGGAGSVWHLGPDERAVTRPSPTPDLPRIRRWDAPETASAGLALPCWRPAFADSAALVRCVASECERGVEFFDFEAIDESPAEAVTWLKQAIRFARRGR